MWKLSIRCSTRSIWFIRHLEEFRYDIQHDLSDLSNTWKLSIGYSTGSIWPVRHVETFDTIFNTINGINSAVGASFERSGAKINQNKWRDTRSVTTGASSPPGPQTWCRGYLYCTRIWYFEVVIFSNFIFFSSARTNNARGRVPKTCSMHILPITALLRPHTPNSWYFRFFFVSFWSNTILLETQNIIHVWPMMWISNFGYNPGQRYILSFRSRKGSILTHISVAVYIIDVWHLIWTSSVIYIPGQVVPLGPEM